MAVELFGWNPERPAFRGVRGRLSRKSGPVNNFGDLLGPLIAGEIIASAVGDTPACVESKQLVSVGSVIHLARDGAVIWGSGANGKVVADYGRMDLDIRAVRGPLTRQRLSASGHVVPEIFGDPALLLGLLFPELVGMEKRHEVTVIMNLNDRVPLTGHNVVSPRDDLWNCLTAIAQSRLVVGSSLHAMVVADALGIPSRPVVSSRENSFKYKDYYLGTGRRFLPARTVREAVRDGGGEKMVWDPSPLLRAFPFDLWDGGCEFGINWVNGLVLK